MSILSGIVAMSFDGTGYEEPSTPSRDPASSPAAHIQWQNSQSACAAMEELRAASSVPRRAPKPLTFDFELPPSAGPSSNSDPFFPPRTRVRSVRSRASGRVQSHSQNDAVAIPAADVSNFLNMLGRASARVDANSRKRMKKARESELKIGRERARVQKPSVKGKERVHSMDELGDHDLRNAVTDTHDAGGHYSSLPIMPSKDSLSHSSATAHVDMDDVQMHVDADTFATTGDDDARPPHLPHPRNGTQRVPPRSPTTRCSQKRAAPPSPTPVRSTPTALRPVSTPAQKVAAAPPKQTPIPPLPSAHHTSTFSQHPIPAPTPPPMMPAMPPPVTGVPSRRSRSAAPPMTPESLPRRGTSTSTSTSTSVLPSSQTHGPKRALGMTWRGASSHSHSHSTSNTPHSAAAKRPFRPPLARPGAPATAASPSPQAAPGAATSLVQPSQRRRRRQEDDESSGTDPDSSFDLSFDFDPEALEAAMRKYD
ncbi:hypothetical protein BJV78DRAFT_622905 [Lactifluus subvellereus]|nr:hypothetical protein BJV78DRAFT_622905 [Lactifluus subvellereus]